MDERDNKDRPDGYGSNTYGRPGQKNKRDYKDFGAFGAPMKAAGYTQPPPVHKTDMSVPPAVPEQAAPESETPGVSGETAETAVSAPVWQRYGNGDQYTARNPQEEENRRGDVKETETVTETANVGQNGVGDHGSAQSYGVQNQMPGGQETDQHTAYQQTAYKAPPETYAADYPNMDSHFGESDESHTDSAPETAPERQEYGYRAVQSDTSGIAQAEHYAQTEQPIQPERYATEEQYAREDSLTGDSGSSQTGSDEDGIYQQRFEGTGNEDAGREDFSVSEANRKITYVADIPDTSDYLQQESPDEETDVREPEPKKAAHPFFEDKYGIQERFDITFLDDEVKTDESESTGYETYYDIEDEDIGDDNYGGYPEESELSEEKDIDGFVGSDEPDNTGDDGAAETEIPSETDELLENNNDIWDDEDRDTWTEHDRFMALCRSLNVPPLKISKQERRRVAAGGENKKRSSGYRYEMVERLPFDEGLRVEDKEAYVKREKAFCEERAGRQGRKLRERQRRRAVKTWCVGIAALLCLMLDCLNFVSIDGTRLVSRDNIMFLAGFEIVLTIVGAIIAGDCVIDGLRCGSKGIFIPEIFTSLAVIMAILYNGSMMLYRELPENAVILGSPALVILFVATLYRYYLSCRDLKAFEITSSYGSYCTEVKMSNFRSTPEYAEFEGYAPRDSALYRINRVARIDGCYNEQPLRDECFGMMRILFAIVVCAALVAGIVFGLIGQSVYNGLLSAFVIIMFASPVSAFVSMFLPRYRAAERASRDGAAIVGFDEESEEFDENVIMIDENDLYPAENVTTKVEVCNLPEIESHIMRAAALFRRLGGTLGYMFGEAGLENKEKVELTEIAEHGVTALVGRSTLRVGDEKYLRRAGVKVARYDGELDRNTRVLYIADDGEFFCRIKMTFRPDEELCRRISELRNSDTLVSLKSCNPCIDSALVFYTTGLEPELLKSIKYAEGDDVSPAETDREGVLISRAGAVGFFTALIEYKRQKKLVFYGSRLAGFTCAAGAAAGLFLCALGRGWAAIPLLAVAFQAVCCGIAGFIGSRNVSGSAVKVKRK